MTRSTPTVAVIGGGIAGLCAAVYARKCGYQVELFEKNPVAGGLATNWKKGEYTFENCLHWLVGSSPGGVLNSQWREIFDIDRLNFLYPETFVSIQNERGERLDIPTNVDRLEEEFLSRAPQDAAEIRAFASAIRRLRRFEMPDSLVPSPRHLKTYLQDLPCLPLIRRLAKISCADYGRGFTDPLIRSFFDAGATSRMSVLAIAFSLAWMSECNAGYPIGGSKAVIDPIVAELSRLGGKLRLGTTVDRILVEGGAAVGVRLTSGETVRADWVISAADRHATIYELLGGQYADRTCQMVEPFPSYVMVSFGVARDLSMLPGFVTRVLDGPFLVDPFTCLSQLSFRIFHYDPTFAPPGKTAVTCFLPTYNYEYWVDLQENDQAEYQKVKNQIAEAVASVLERVAPSARHGIEAIDVSTPATVIRYTGNWRGSMEGWLPTPAIGFQMLPNSISGLQRFVMAGHWVQPGGGLPSGLLTARSAVQAMCKEDRIRFTPGAYAVSRSKAA